MLRHYSIVEKFEWKNIAVWHKKVNNQVNNQDCSYVILALKECKMDVVKLCRVKNALFGSRYSRMEQVKFVEDSVVLKAVFHKFY